MDQPFVTTPERRANRQGLYDLDGGEHLGGHIDQWHYEPDLPAAIESLVDPTNPLSARQWIDTLVPFVAGLWVRTPDRNRGVNNEGRIVEFQEVLAPVAASDWSVAHFPPNSLVTSDRGFAVVAFQNLSAFVAPLDAQTLLILSPGDTTRIARDRNTRWSAPVSHDLATTIDAKLINEAICSNALQDIYGPTRSLVEASRFTAVFDPLSNGLPFLRVDTDLRAHFYDYFRLRAAVRADPGSEREASERAGWTDLGLAPRSLIALEVLRPERTRGGVFADSDSVVLTLEWGRVIKALRMAAGELVNGASVVASVEQLQSATRPVKLGLEWSLCGMDMEAVPMVDLETGDVCTANLAKLREDIGRSLRHSASES